VTRTPLNIAVFASGGGTNFQALLDHQAESKLWRVAVLVMNRDAGAAKRAVAAGVPVRVIATKDRAPRDVSSETRRVLDECAVDVIVLSGYLRLLPPAVVDLYGGRILNIHPALLPDFGGKGMYGLNVHRAVVQSGVDVTGATVHFVTGEYDEGSILGQWQVHVETGDTPEDVGARVLRVEHRLYPKAVDHLCEALVAKRPVTRMKDVRLNEPPIESRSTKLTEEER
jgi:phosphoribosylglycinamide formyltransferase-1